MSALCFIAQNPNPNKQYQQILGRRDQTDKSVNLASARPQGPGDRIPMDEIYDLFYQDKSNIREKFTVSTNFYTGPVSYSAFPFS